MTTMRKLLLVGFLAVVCLAGSADAQDKSKLPPGFTGTDYVPPTPRWRGQSGMTYLQIGGSARAEGMGGTFIAVKGDPGSILYNPAGMASVRGVGLYLNRTSWLADMTVNHLVASYNTGLFTVGLTFQSMDYGDITGTIVTDAPPNYEIIGNVDATAWTAGLFYAMSMTDNFSFGVHVKWVTQDFGKNQKYTFIGDDRWTDEYDENSIGEVAIDIGTQYTTALRNLTVNMAFQNFASSLRYIDNDAKFDMPLTYRVGLAAEAFEMVTGTPNPTQKIMVYVDGVDQRDVTLDVATGIEYIVDLDNLLPGTKVALRTGRRPSKEQDGWLNFGGSIEFGIGAYDARLDYSYNDYGPDLTASRIGLALAFK